MGTLCNECGLAVNNKKEPVYETEMFGVTVSLINAVTVTFCGCDEEITIPNQRGLIAAMALVRAGMPQKLSGKEIKFLRKVMDKPANEMAVFLDVDPATLSRWENDKVPISIIAEKFMRMTAVSLLEKDAPIVETSLEDISQLEITGFNEPGASVHLCLELVKYKEKRKEIEEQYLRNEAA